MSALNTALFIRVWQQVQARDKFIIPLIFACQRNIVCKRSGSNQCVRKQKSVTEAIFFEQAHGK